MNFEIKIISREGRSTPLVTRAGVWSASNVHTAVKRAVTGYPCEKKPNDIAATGAPKFWTKLKVGEAISIEVRRL